MRADSAREVIARCDFFLDKLRENPSGVAWEAQFSGCLALLRSVGHVLDKCDAPLSTAKWWTHSVEKNKAEHPIFWEFILEDRNLILKEGQIRAGQSAHVGIVGVEARALTGRDNLTSPPSAPQPTASFTYQMNEGVFAGRDPRELIADAIEWWKTQVSSIENDHPHDEGKINESV